MPTCIEWNRGRSGNGYGHVWYEGRVLGAHRKVFFDCNGWWPVVVRHACDNKACVNPAHLLPGTVRDNTQDAADRNLLPSGEAHWNCRLSNSAIQELKTLRARGATYAELGERFGVSRQHASRIVRGTRRYKELPW